MNFDVKLTNTAQNEMKDILEKDPRAGSSLRWQFKGYWSYHTGNYRIVYEIDDNKKVVLVSHIKHRRNIYRDMQRR